MENSIGEKLFEILDVSLVNGLFAIPAGEEFTYVKERRYYTTANNSVGGSGLGNSRVINPIPGINPFCEPPRGYGMTGEKGTGSGFHYHEMLEKNMEVLHLRPGTTRFSPVTKFWSNAFNQSLIDSNEYGWFHKAVSAVSEFVGSIFNAAVSFVTLPFKLLNSLIFGQNADRYSYYYLSPAPLAYFTMLDNMVNDAAVRLGIMGNVRFTEASDDGSSVDNPLDDAAISNLISSLPGILTESSFIKGVPKIDTLSIAHRYTMMQHARTEYLKKKSIEILGQEFSNDEDFLKALGEWEDVYKNQNPITAVDGDSGDKRLLKIREALVELNTIQETNYDALMGGSNQNINLSGDDFQTVNVDGSPTTERTSSESSRAGEHDAFLDYNMDSFSSLYKNIAKGGADWVSINIDKIEEYTVSLSNDVGPSGIEGMFNSAVSGAKAAWFNVAGGNFTDNIVGQTLEGLAKTGATALNGLLGQVTGGLPSALLGGKAFLDMPNVYQGSSTDFGALSCSLTSRAASGHPYAKLQMLFVYFALVCLCAPRSAGPRSYMSPFLVEAFIKGKGIIDMGMIVNLSATFASEAGWDENEVPNDIKITFDLVNMSKNFHIPLDPNLAHSYTDKSEFNNHMAVITGTSLTDYDMSFAYNTKTRFLRTVGKLDRFFSKSHWAMMSGVATRSVLETPMNMFGAYTRRSGD